MEPTAPQASMIISKYLTDSRISTAGKKLPCSWVWVVCKLGGGIFNQWVKWNIQNGKSTLFWWDFWLNSETCRSLILGPLTEAEFSFTVADIHPFEGE